MKFHPDSAAVNFGENNEISSLFIYLLKCEREDSRALIGSFHFVAQSELCHFFNGLLT